MHIPEHGWGASQVLETLESYKRDDVDWRSGRAWGYVYDPGHEAEVVIKTAFGSFLTENGLDPTVFPSSARLETELVDMARRHLNGDENVVGNFTSGGTESIMLAVKACRDWARDVRPQIDRPEIILPSTAHAAFHKAAHYLGLERVLVPVDPGTFRADPAAIEAAITPNTIMLVASAVSYAHGVVDPIPEIGAIAVNHDLWLHVDGCMGGFLLPYFRRLGRDIVDFDFTVPGVRTISMDLHKYAFAAKGASCILHRSKNYRRYQMYCGATWTGYTVINPTVQSTKSGGPMAGAWAALHFIGDDGYLEIARKVLDATDRIVAGIDAMDDLRVLGRPEMNLVGFTSDTVNVFHVIDEMQERGWYVQPQLQWESSKENIHLSINPASVHWVDDLLKDLQTCVDTAKTLPSGNLAEELAPMLENLDPDALTAEAYQGMLEMAGIGEGNLPGRMADINEIMNTLPRPVTEQLVIEYFNELL